MTNSLREEATKAASVLLERNARLEKLCQLLSKDGTKKACRIGIYTAKEVRETRPTDLRILPVRRLPFTPFNLHEVSRPLPATVKFFYTDFSRSDPDSIQLKKANELPGNLENVMWKPGQMAQLDLQPTHTQSTSLLCTLHYSGTAVPSSPKTRAPPPRVPRVHVACPACRTSPVDTCTPSAPSGL